MVAHDSLSHTLNEIGESEQIITKLLRTLVQCIFFEIYMLQMKQDTKKHGPGPSRAKRKLPQLKQTKMAHVQSNIRYVLRFVGGFLVSFPTYLLRSLPLDLNAENIWLRISHCVTHSINSINTLMGLS